MSLINDLLRDLDARHAPRPGNALAAGQPLFAAAGPVRAARRSMGLLLGVLVFAAGAAGSWHYYSGLAAPAPAVPVGVPARDVPRAVIEPVGDDVSVPLAPAAQTPAPGGLSDPTAVRVAAAAPAVAPAQTPAARKPATPAPAVARGKPPQEALPTVSVEPPPAPKRVVASLQPARSQAIIEKSSQAGKPAPAQPAHQAETAGSGLVRTPRVASTERVDQEAVTAAREALQSGRPDRAESILRTRLLETPEAHTSRVLLATLLLQQERLAEADRLVAAGLHAAPAHAGLLLHQARVKLSQGDAVAALAALQAVPPSETDSPEFLAMLAVSTQKLGDHVAATALYRNLLQRYPPQANWWVGLAVSLEASAMPKEAGDAYREGAKLSGDQHGLRRFANERLAALAQVGDS